MVCAERKSVVMVDLVIAYSTDVDFPCQLRVSFWSDAVGPLAVDADAAVVDAVVDAVVVRAEF